MSDKLKIYIAGPLFSDSEIRDRKETAEVLRKMGYDCYNPIEQNSDIGYHLEELYRRDIEAMTECDFSVLHVDGEDPGTIAELGWLTAMNKPVFSVYSNWKYQEPTNLFVRGLTLQKPNRLFKSFAELYQFLNTYKHKSEIE